MAVDLAGRAEPTKRLRKEKRGREREREETGSKGPRLFPRKGDSIVDHDCGNKEGNVTRREDSSERRQRGGKEEAWANERKREAARKVW